MDVYEKKFKDHIKRITNWKPIKMPSVLPDGFPDFVVFTPFGERFIEVKGSASVKHLKTYMFRPSQILFYKKWCLPYIAFCSSENKWKYYKTMRTSHATIDFKLIEFEHIKKGV